MLESKDGRIEVLNDRGVQFLPGVVEVLLGLDEMGERRIDDLGIGRVIVWALGNYLACLLQEAFALVGHPDRGSFR